MARTLAQWNQALTAETLLPAYLLAGEELLVLEAADALRARARALGFVERQVLEAGTHFDWDELARAAASLSLFATSRLIDLRLPTGRPGKEGAAAISEFCQAPPPATCLLITALEWSNKHEAAWSRQVDSQGMQMVFAAPRPQEWGRWITQRLAAQQLSAAPEAVQLLAERVEGNLLAAAQEVDKLAMLHQPGQRISLQDMRQWVADSARYDVFKLTDAAFAGEGARALKMLAGLRAEGAELIGLLGWLVNQLQLAWRLAASDDFAAQAKRERLWPAREKLFRQALRQAGREHWLGCLQQAGRIDRIAKGRLSGDAWLEAERLVAAIAMPRRWPLSA